MSDADILEVIQPPNSDIATRQSHIHDKALPPVEDWRFQPSVGCVLSDSNQVVRSNHFLVNTRNIPGHFFQYHLHIYSYGKDGLGDEDIAKKEDYRITVTLVDLFKKLHPEFTEIDGARVGFVYDSRNCVITTQQLPLPDTNENNEPYVSDDVYLLKKDGSKSNRCFKMCLTFAATIAAPPDSREGWANSADASVIRALDLSLLAFARQQLKDQSPSWYLVGNKCFSQHASKLSVAPGYEALRGYTVGLKSCLAGLTLVSDMTVSVFLSGGPLVNVVANICGYENTEFFLKDTRRHGFDERNVPKVEKALKNCKIRIDHLGHSKKIKTLGPPANHRDSSFDCKGEMVTVAEYFAKMAAENSSYREFMRGSELQFPFLPTVNIGTRGHPVLMPMELVSVRDGQSFSRCTGDMTAKVVRHAAILPQERFQNLLDNDKRSRDSQSALTALRGDSEAATFGVTDFDFTPMSVSARLLPPPRLQYKDETQSPGLSGDWNILQGRPTEFFKLPPNPARDGSYMYGMLIVSRSQPRDWEGPTRSFKSALEKDAASVGLKLFLGGPPLICSERPQEIKDKAGRMQSGGVRILIVILMGDFYCDVKLATDSMGLITQCLKWKNLLKPPRGFHMNVMLKVNTKLGGTNHTLASRCSPEEARAAAPCFQDPPASLGWVFNEPCMLVGIDTSHAEPGSNRSSVAAVVGSLNGQASQYAAHISAQAPRVEMVSALTDAMDALFKTFKSKNGGQMPKRILVYRDGVGEGQFEEVLSKELECIRDALALNGDVDACKIALIVCQKRHHTRLVYEDAPGNFVNCCPGLCVDGSGGEKSITSASHNEFFLNSHTAIQGTAKCCKYSLVYDDIGLKIAELELLTYWSCYLYARCNRSVSIATPVYYAHWASRRAKHLFTAGAEDADLAKISDLWSKEDRESTMFFV